MQVVHGEVGDVFGAMQSHGDFGFVNAAVSLAGASWSSEFNLQDFPDLSRASTVASLVERGIDAIWVVGRLKAAFGTWIELHEGEKSILYEGFVAHAKSDGICVPFVLHDYYLRTAFLFGESLQDRTLKVAIARSFYELLLADPCNVADFDFRKDHLGAGITMVGGIVQGQVQYDEER